jgi:histidinol-phosphate aminotransferase
MIEKLVRKDVVGLPEYVPGKSKDEVVRQYGLDREEVVKLASNENPFGPPPLAVEEIRRCAGEVNFYPEAGAETLRKELARYLALKPGNVIVGNGSDEVMELAVKAFMNREDEAIIPVPTFSMYEGLIRTYSGKVVKQPLGEDFEYDVEELLKKITSRTKLVFVCSPNNPTGSVISVKGLQEILEREILVILDEAYVEFAEESRIPLVKDYDNLLVLRTFSKAFGLAGLRVGYGVAGEDIIKYLFRVKPPFNVNLLAQQAALQALRDTEHLELTVARTLTGRKFLARELSKLSGVTVFPSQGNFLLLEVRKRAHSAAKIASELLKEGIIVRTCESFGLGSNYLRVSIGREDENRRFLEAFKEKLSHGK